ncbi:hypothetical protein ACFW0P_00085 [Lysobacter soli]
MEGLLRGANNWFGVYRADGTVRAFERWYVNPTIAARSPQADMFEHH